MQFNKNMDFDLIQQGPTECRKKVVEKNPNGPFNANSLQQYCNLLEQSWKWSEENQNNDRFFLDYWWKWEDKLQWQWVLLICEGNMNGYALEECKDFLETYLKEKYETSVDDSLQSN